jgi:hypothetical protein
MRTEWSSRALEIGSRFVVPGYVAGSSGVFRGPGDRPQHRYCVCRADQAQRQCQGARRRGE